MEGYINNNSNNNNSNNGNTENNSETYFQDINILKDNFEITNFMLKLKKDELAQTNSEIDDIENNIVMTKDEIDSLESDLNYSKFKLDNLQFYLKNKNSQDNKMLNKRNQLQIELDQLLNKIKQSRSLYYKNVEEFYNFINQSSDYDKVKTAINNKKIKMEQDSINLLNEFYDENIGNLNSNDGNNNVLFKKLQDCKLEYSKFEEYGINKKKELLTIREKIQRLDNDIFDDDNELLMLQKRVNDLKNQKQIQQTTTINDVNNNNNNNVIKANVSYNNGNNNQQTRPNITYNNNNNGNNNQKTTTNMITPKPILSVNNNNKPTKQFNQSLLKQNPQPQSTNHLLNKSYNTTTYKNKMSKNNNNSNNNNKNNIEINYEDDEEDDDDDFQTNITINNDKKNTTIPVQRNFINRN